jgi:hypothetical protein
MAVTAKSLSQTSAHVEENEDPKQHLMLDPRPRGEMNAMVMDSMHTTSKKFWGVTIFLTLTVVS